MSHKYLLGSLKACVERIFAGNISVENYLDTYMVAQGFECFYLQDRLFEFGQNNVQLLRAACVFQKLEQKD
jgi:hypothetical protein